jgi:hypothetical protein
MCQRPERVAGAQFVSLESAEMGARAGTRQLAAEPNSLSVFCCCKDFRLYKSTTAVILELCCYEAELRILYTLNFLETT